MEQVERQGSAAIVRSSRPPYRTLEPRLSFVSIIASVLAIISLASPPHAVASPMATSPMTPACNNERGTLETDVVL